MAFTGVSYFRRRGDRWPREILHISYFRLHAVQISVIGKHAQWFFGVGWGGVQWHALYLHTCSMLRNCTCAHIRCYAIALAHMFDATQLYLRTCSMLRNCTCAHVRRKIRTTLSSSRFGRGRGWPRGSRPLPSSRTFSMNDGTSMQVRGSVEMVEAWEPMHLVPMQGW